jgi:hypothetical protein
MKPGFGYAGSADRLFRQVRRGRGKELRRGRCLQAGPQNDAPRHHPVLGAFSAIAPAPEVATRLELGQQSARGIEELRFDRGRYAHGIAAQDVASHWAYGEPRTPVDRDNLAKIPTHRSYTLLRSAQRAHGDELGIIVRAAIGTEKYPNG